MIPWHRPCRRSGIETFKARESSGQTKSQSNSGLRDQPENTPAISTGADHGMQISFHVVRRPWRYHVVLGFAAVAILLTALAAAPLRLGGTLNVDWLNGRGPETWIEASDASVLAPALCAGTSDAPALRLWVSQHPKSPRGRLDHKRLRLQSNG
jgi:hypothetical protein